MVQQATADVRIQPIMLAWTFGALLPESATGANLKMGEPLCNSCGLKGSKEEVLERGRKRYNIYYSSCHPQVGDSIEIIVQRGFKRPPSYHIDRLRKAPIGHFYNVMTNGYGAMADYASQVPVSDRWAIAAYIRALQLSQNATPSDVPPGATIASQLPQVNAIWPPPMENTKAMHGEGAGLREGKNE